MKFFVAVALFSFVLSHVALADPAQKDVPGQRSCSYINPVIELGTDASSQMVLLEVVRKSIPAAVSVGRTRDADVTKDQAMVCEGGATITDVSVNVPHILSALIKAVQAISVSTEKLIASTPEGKAAIAKAAAAAEKQKNKKN